MDRPPVDYLRDLVYLVGLWPDAVAGLAVDREFRGRLAAWLRRLWRAMTEGSTDDRA